MRALCWTIGWQLFVTQFQCYHNYCQSIILQFSIKVVWNFKMHVSTNKEHEKRIRLFYFRQLKSNLIMIMQCQKVSFRVFLYWKRKLHKYIFVVTITHNFYWLCTLSHTIFLSCTTSCITLCWLPTLAEFTLWKITGCYFLHRLTIDMMLSFFFVLCVNRFASALKLILSISL